MTTHAHGLTQGVRSSANQLESESARPLAAKADIRAVFVGSGFSLLRGENDYRTAHNYGIVGWDRDRLTFSFRSSTEGDET
jgi:hypothetical protein